MADLLARVGALRFAASKPLAARVSASMQLPFVRRRSNWRGVLRTVAWSSAATLATRMLLTRQSKIAERLTTDYAAGDDTFARSIAQLLGAPLVACNKVTGIENGDRIFPALLAAIARAERTITFENFLWRIGEVGDAFADALAARARAGVRVHLLQDGLGCQPPVMNRSMRLLRRSGVDVQIYRLRLNPSLNHRTHQKILVVDGREGYIGGACIADGWKGDGQTRGYWRDSYYRVEGPVVAQLQRAFSDHWIQQRGAVLHGNGYFPVLEPAGDDTCQVFESYPGQRTDSARLMLLLSLAAARRHIRVATPYFIPDNLLRQAFVDALRRGVRLEVIVPGADIDAQLARSVGKARWRPLLEAGARFYEYEPARLHCKYLIVDDRWTSVGSLNLDNRALSLNEEANLNVLSHRFAAEQTRVFEDDKSRSREITLAGWRRRPVNEKIRGAVGSAVRAQV